MRYLRRAVTYLVVMVAMFALGGFAQNYFGSRLMQQHLLQMVPPPKDEQVQAAVVKLLAQGRADELYDFYSQDAGTRSDAAFWTVGALHDQWMVSKVMAMCWYARTYASKGRQNPVDLGAVGAAMDADAPAISLADYMRMESQAEAKVNASMNDMLRPAFLAMIATHSQEMNRRFAIKFGDVLDW